ncbi:DODA-type extradiol aromatic ring-opening family dioxygenase [Stenotrophobium rhamnosiphilum]|uniref:DODA-type extradiol aromatic ring-opening family dioxygenase n=1 Tax=Stenotrophobium rhamnosiphilum TaxID=2029166 RepID=UPI001374E2F2|nr:class III extradiol ring-cleavage dioxygenase [Stenotrophobium rhamnosiphilum]
MNTLQPRALFISHGAPTLALDKISAHQFLIELGQRLPKPRAVVVISPHWSAPIFAIKQDERYRAWHDFGGFPDELYQIQYSPQGNASLAARIFEHLQKAQIATRMVSDPRLDHGVWVPLMLMYPDADVPVVNVACLGRDPQVHYELGRALRDAVDDDVLIIGSGSAVHNLHELAAPGTPPASWATRFDDWLNARIEAGDHEALLDYRAQAPDAARAHPTEDHLMPFYVALGAGGGKGQALHRSFSYGNLSMACYGFPAAS